MSQTAAASKEYLKNTVMTARPEQLQLMLLDGAIRFATKGRAAIEAKDYSASFENLDRAQRICAQLSEGLNRDVNPELVDRMAALFEFCYMRLVTANTERDVTKLDEAVQILRHQRDTWQIICDKVANASEAGATPPPKGAAVPAGSALKLEEEPPSSLNLEG
jgi:flagellar protein FliS